MSGGIPCVASWERALATGEVELAELAAILTTGCLATCFLGEADILKSSAGSAHKLTTQRSSQQAFSRLLQGQLSQW